MNLTKKRACGLVRVSSEEQAKAGYGLEYQEADIRAFCARNDLDLVQIFRDEGYSGATAARPGFQEMMQYARDSRFDVLVVWKLDRLFRDTKLTLQTVDELASLDVEFRSVQESFTHDSNGRFLLTIFAAGAEKERKDIAMRMHAGRVASAKNGTWISGASTPPFGYRYNPTTKRLEIDDDEARVVRQLYRWLCKEKLSLYQIQTRLNAMKVPTKFDRLGRKKPTGSTCWWSKRTIGRILSNEVYTGTFTFRKYADLGSVQKTGNLRPKEDWIVAHCPPIISVATFHKAQDQLKTNRENSPRRTKKLYLLSKLLICGHDNRRMQAASRPAEGTHRECKYYFCTGTRKSFAPVRCPSSTVSESRIAPPVWDKVRQLLSDPDTVLARLSEYRARHIQSEEFPKRQKSIESQLQKATGRRNRLVELYLGEAVDQGFFQAERRRLDSEIQGYERELRKLDESIVSEEELAKRIMTVQSLYEAYKERLECASDQIKRQIFQTFIKAVIVRGDDLEIEVLLPEPATVRPTDSIFVGQAPHLFPHKATPTFFLQTKLAPLSQIFRDRELYKNFTKNRH